MLAGVGLLVALTAVLVPLASAAAASPAPVNACALLSAHDVAAETGLDVGAGRRDDQGVTDKGAYSSTCVWIAPLAPGATPDPRAPFGGASFAMLNVIAWPNGAAGAKSYIQDFRDAAKSDLLDSQTTDVAIGDEGLAWANGVAARKQAVSFGVSVRLASPSAAVRDMEEALAREVTARLP
jgi:hypothetical protein